MEPDALTAVASPRRRRILHLVLGKEMGAGELASHFDVSWPAISQHLGVLKQAGLISERREGRRRFYITDSAHLGPLESVLREMWKSDLDRLADLAESDERESR